MRRLLSIWIVLAAIVGAAVPSSAQMSPIPGFPPGTFQNRAALDAPSGGGPPTFVYRGSEGGFFNPASTATFTTIDFGAGAANKYVVCAFSNQNGRVLDTATAGGVSLARDVQENTVRGLSIWSALANISGVQNVVVTSSTSSIFEDITAMCWSGTGLTTTTGATSTQTGVSTTSISISAATDALLISLYGFPVTNSGSTQTPSVRSQVGGGAAITTNVFEFNPVTTPGSFTVGTSGAANVAAASYR